jgi:S1-C subfamily serine protease
VGLKISSVNGRKFDDLISVGRHLWRLRPGEKITLQDIGGKNWILTAGEFEPKDGRQIARNRLDLSLVELDKSVAASLDYPFTGGLVVTQGSKDNPDIRRGEILVRLNDSGINSFDDIARAMKNVRYGQKIGALLVILVKRAGNVYIVKKEAVIEVK